MTPILTNQLNLVANESYHCVYYHVGLKAFQIASAANVSCKRQALAFELQVAPPVMSEVFLLPEIGHCYLTGHAEPATILHKTTRDNWQDNRDNLEFVDLCRKIQMLMPRYQDLHSENIGIWDNRLVCIDFYNGCYWI